MGFDEEMDWLEEIVGWQFEWSALHGIAEVKTPLLRISSETDVTMERLTVRYMGAEYPHNEPSG